MFIDQNLGLHGPAQALSAPPLVSLVQPVGIKNSSANVAIYGGIAALLIPSIVGGLIGYFFASKENKTKYATIGAVAAQAFVLLR